MNYAVFFKNEVLKVILAKGSTFAHITGVGLCCTALKKPSVSYRGLYLRYPKKQLTEYVVLIFLLDSVIKSRNDSRNINTCNKALALPMSVKLRIYVIPAKAGIHSKKLLKVLDSCFRRNDINEFFFLLT